MKKILKIFITIISLLFISYFGSIVAICVSNNEAEFYGMVNNDGYGHFDFTGYRMEDERIYVGQHGNVEFYYNKWIHTDKEDISSPNYINLPRYWTGLEIDGKTLPRDGYASYRIVTYNLKPGISISSSFMRMPSKIFFNGVLAYEIGTPTKQKQSAGVPLEGKTYPYIVPEDGIVEVIIEVGNCGIGGIRTMPGFTLTSNLPYPYAIFLDQYNMAFAAIMVVIFLFSFLSFALPKTNNGLVMMVCSFFLIYITSVDTPFYIKELGFNYRNSVLDMILNAISIFITCITYSFYLNKQKIIKFNKPKLIIYSLLGILFLASFPFTYNTYYAFISYGFISLVAIDIIINALITYIKKDNAVNLLNLLCIGSFYSLLNFSMIGSTGILIFDLTTFYQTISLFLIIFFMIVYLININNIKKEVIKNNEIQEQISLLYSRSLINCMNIDEINNGLSTIKTEFEKCNEDGMQATYLFSTSLRNEINGLDYYLLPFDIESKKLLDKIAFKNIETQKNLNVIFDIEETDYLIPSTFFSEIIDEIYYNIDNNQDIFITLTKNKNIHLEIQVNSYRKNVIPIIDNLKERMNLLNWNFSIKENSNSTIYELESR